MGDAQPTILLHFIPKPGFRTAVQIFEELTLYRILAVEIQ